MARLLDQETIATTNKQMNLQLLKPDNMIEAWNGNKNNFKSIKQIQPKAGLKLILKIALKAQLVIRPHSLHQAQAKARK